MIRAFKYRAYCNQTTEQNAKHWLYLCCQLYNAALEQRNDCYYRLGWGRMKWRERQELQPSRRNVMKCRATKERSDLTTNGLNFYEQATELKRLKEEFPEFSDVGSQVLKDVLARLDKGFKLFFTLLHKKPQANPSPPSFRKSSKYRSFTFPNASGWRLTDNMLHIAKVGTFKLRPKIAPLGTIRTVTIKRSDTGKWFVIFSCKDVPERPLPKTGNVIALDLGLNRYLTDSNGMMVDNPEPLRKNQRKIRNLQRKLSRQKLGSNRRRKTLQELRILFEKVTNQRKDFHCKLALDYAKDNDRIIIEDLSIKQMIMDDCDIPGLNLHGRIGDVAWGYFAHRLQNKCEEGGRELIRIDPAYTTRTCSNCGYMHEDPQWKMVFKCPACGLEIDRPLNSARNIFQLGEAHPSGANVGR
jgi:putative transposase